MLLIPAGLISISQNPKDNGGIKIKLTLKQEKFCNELLATGSQAAAYRNSYRTESMKPGTIHTAALELMRNPTITRRLNELRDATAKRNEVTVDSLMNELEDARQLAIETKSSSAMTAATLGKARLLGLDRIVVAGNMDSQITLIQRIIVDKVA